STCGRQIYNKTIKKRRMGACGNSRKSPKMKKTGMPPIIIPVHGTKDLKPGTLRKIERATGIIYFARPQFEVFGIPSASHLVMFKTLAYE
ncbi:MAG: hypothetical protein WBW31_21375, partial [Candidatus Sulfotelmatobacter sp.]